MEYPDILQYYSIIEDDDTGNKKYLCHKCGARLNSLHSIRNHVIIIHLKLSPLVCPLCPEKFQYDSKRRNHMKLVHGIRVWRRKINATVNCVDGKYICHHCSREYKNEESLQNHIWNVHRISKCTECGIDFNHLKLPIHKHEAHGAPIPTCGVCGYKHPSNHRVIKHQRKVHLKEKNTQCELCELKFFDTHDLVKHMVRHKSERKHECRFCHKKFPRKSTLDLHEKIHTGEKNKVCSICSDRFVQKASLNYHMAKHHPEVAF